MDRPQTSHGNDETPRPWFDLQVNGGLGLDFNADDWDFDAADRVAEEWLEMGCRGLLATVITDSETAMQRRIRHVADWIEHSRLARQCIAGIHVEGPFLNADDGYVGAHPPRWTQDANPNTITRLVDAGRGHVKLWTLSPERDADAAMTRFLVDQNVVVGMGHCRGSLDDIQRSLDAGLSVFTHLGNGCPHRHDRHDHLINRVLSVGDRIKITFIADGHHIPFFALQNYVRCLPESQVIIVSDAMQAAGLSAGTYHLGDQVVYVDEHQAAWAEDRSHYAGSATLLPAMADKLLRAKIGTEEQIQMWIHDNPMQLIQS
ncbi:MAG: N-acetylglucosamine-6-phosphate deacetylase [Planctomycetota bacterium]